MKVPPLPPVKPLVNDLNWNLLRSFCAIAEEKGFTRAAKRLNMSQPSVSQALQRLEEQLGCQLVFRDSRRFALTLRGERVYQECAEILRGVDRIAVLSQKKVLVAGPLAEVEQTNDAWIQEYFHGPRGQRPCPAY